LPFIIKDIKGMFYEALTFISEIVLSAYPILIKKVPASLTAQVTLRMATFAILAGIASAVTGAPLLQGSTPLTILGPGLLNLLHVGSSYTAFEALPAGNAMALFYTYPVWNILGAAATFGEKIDLSILPWMGIALVGTLLVAEPTATNWNVYGVVAALLAAITETGIYLWFRKEPESHPWTTMARMYGGSALLLLPLFLLGFLTWGKMGKGALSSMLLFNAIVGFIGYAMRFYTIPHVSTVTFSSISFFGIVAAYLLGWVFVGEVPHFQQGIGAALIILANLFLLRQQPKN
jgi:drug/metabolite transporter (DMT)-like permease